jgi:hypothetical protein
VCVALQVSPLKRQLYEVAVERATLQCFQLGYEIEKRRAVSRIVGPNQRSTIGDVLTGFGAASYNAQVLERKLVILLSSLFAARNFPAADRAFDRTMDRFEANTLGELIGKLCQLLERPVSLENRLRDALDARNYLAHRFFWEHAEDELSEAGRAKMISELSALSTQLYELSGKLETLNDAFMRALLSRVARQKGLPLELAASIDRLYKQSAA